MIKMREDGACLFRSVGEQDEYAYFITLSRSTVCICSSLIVRGV